MNKNQWIGVAIGIVVIVAFVYYAYAGGFINQSPINLMSGSQSNLNASETAETVASSGATTTDELGVKDVVVGSGATAAPGDYITVNYVGTLTDGTQFDSSYNHGQPFSFVLGAGQVIKGWDEGLVGMKVGGKRDLIIPPSLGYGANAVGPIPANSTLLFEVELVDVSAANPNQ